MTLRQGQPPTEALGPMAGDMGLGLNYQMLQLLSVLTKEINRTHPKTNSLHLTRDLLAPLNHLSGV